MVRLRLAAAVAALLLCPLAAGAADLPDPWVQFTAAGAEARAIVGPGMACPAVTADGATLPMARRTPPDDAYPVQLCVLRVPDGVRRLAVGGLPVAVPHARLHRIVVLGDTGCRLKGDEAQDCNDPAAWPFAAVARRAALRRPDLVIHAGDYYYRESACPPGRAGCAGSPWGDFWEVWRRDFFVPAAPLLAAAPWVMVRGNHELCGRGGQGWFRLLDPTGSVTDCPTLTDPFAVRLPGLDLLVLDSADADDATAAPDKAAALRLQAQALFALIPLSQPGPHAWLLTHRPVWALAEGGDADPGLQANATLREALRGIVPAWLDMVVSGHVHMFAAYDFGPGRPAQLVVGNGGDSTEGVAQPAGPGTLIDAMAVQELAAGCAPWLPGAGPVRRPAGAAPCTAPTTPRWRIAGWPGAACRAARAADAAPR